ncbi:MAG: leucine--tRNA ligase, partial [Methanobrevibacter sp.]|nr:leucine--tRNA ligase [Methanobrevibacter sp.]
FTIDDKVLVTATLRPETIVGATNIWLNPDVEYVLVDAEGENWVITKEAHYNLQHQIKDLKIIEEIDPNDLIGKMATNPFTGAELPIFPASFVSASYGSGVVFSEPADAPADYIALQDLKNNDEMIAKYNLEGIIENVEPIPVCTLKGYGEIPAADIIERLGITDQNDEKLHEATNELYKQQHSKGKIIDSIPEFGGMKVRFAREELKEKLINDNIATVMYDFAERPVVCRCGNNCVVKIMDDQWFMKYGNEEWTEKTLEVLEGETVIPKEIKNNFEYYLNWLDDWACSRKVGLGTRLPWDDQWLIEPLTDSTIYMSYYSIAKYLRDMNPDDLNRAFFDKVLLNKDSGEITVPADKVKEIQDEFNYWYPLDWRLSAKDLVGNHLSFLMFHHSAIYPKEKWPRGTVVFGMGLLEGNKMSSSKGNVILLKDAIKDYTADVVRLFLMASAEPWQDFDWREKEVLGTKRRLEWFREFAARVEEIKGSPLDLSNIEPVELTRTIDLWMMSQLNQHIKNATEALEVFQTRQALQDSLFLLKKDVDHYIYRVKHIIDDKDPAVIYVLSTVLESWIRLLAPFTPHTSEELWSAYGGEGFVSQAAWPEADESLISPVIEKSEGLVENIIKDIAHIKQMVKDDVEKIHIYLAPDWKWDLYKIADEVGKPDIGQIMGRAIGAKIYDDKKEIAMVAKKIGKEITKTRYIGKINEAEILTDALDYIKEECGNEVVIHTDDSYDPQNKAKNAMPYKPAIFME